jgi:ketosteroid isomerase-like protein
MLSPVDRLDIAEVVARADTAATRRDADAYVSCFTDEAVLDGSMGSHVGKEALRESVGPIWEAEGSSSVHATLNTLVRQVDEDRNRAIATSFLLILRNGPSLSIHSVSVITQHLVKSDAGWLIARRSVAPVTGDVA